MDISFNPVLVEKGRVQLAIVPMPDSPDLDEGAVNRLTIGVRYLKDGMGRQGRGYYLTITGAAYDGRFESHILMQDPSVYIAVENAKRFSAKRLDELAAMTPEKMDEEIQTQVAKAQRYYETKGRAEQPEPGSWRPPSRV